ncbi:MAG: efflux transporter outer membrane subunit [Sterolibacteriaceae bacterium MAG5]|nr:efflux transporter outer membrane subunit [Candidatus Nitricoxidireducens bremensis]
MIKYAPLIAAVLLGGCSLMAEYERPAAPVAAQWPAAAKADGQRKVAETDWRRFFPDPRLQGLIAAALEHNRDMRIAVARVEEARAQYGVARADRFPGVSLGAGRNASRTPGDLTATGRPLNSQRYDVSLSMTAFELDFWSRVKSQSDAAQAAYLATEEARRAFHLSLVADVANAYLTLLEMDERTALSAATVRSREETRRLVAKRREVGIASDLDFLQADGAYETAKADLANLERQRAAAENALVLLVGRSPEDLPPGKGLADQGIVADLAVGLPADVLLERPDVLAAERKLEAAHASVGAARAAFLPKILLTASLGTASRALSGLFDAGSGAWSFQPTIAMPLFDWGRTSAGVDLAQAREVVAVAEYEKAIQLAFREVADLLAAREKLAAQVAALEATEQAQARRLKLADARYQAGISSFLEVLDAQRESYAARQAAIQQRRALLAAAAQLYKALGGGGDS